MPLGVCGLEHVMSSDGGAAKSLALYVHWPWCLAKCPYCDFNSNEAPDADVDQGAYRDAILSELAHYANLTPGQTITSVFFGGGTPSLMDPKTVEAILDATAAHWSIAPDCEITLEANPTSVEAAKFRDFREAGINRASIGVQALNDADLRALGREHGAEEAMHALQIASAVFSRFSFDLIYARPGQGVGDWADELEHALSIAGDHLSLYQLTVEPGTVFFRQKISEASEDLAADLYELTQDMCEDAGLPAYEVSNHARPGQESRHNMTYWQGGDYIGVGPGAHGRLSQDTQTYPGTGGGSPVSAVSACYQINDPARWLDTVQKNGHATAKVMVLSPRQRLEEVVLSGLRISQGLDAKRFQTLTGQSLHDTFNREVLVDLQDLGLLQWDAKGLRATAHGRMMLNTLIDHLLDGDDDDPPSSLM